MAALTRLFARLVACECHLALLVLAGRLGDGLERLADAPLARRLESQVADRDDADEPLLAVEHGQPAHLPLAHLARHAGDILVVEDVSDLGRHNVRAFARSGAMPWATARTAISRSVIMPTRRSFSPSGSAPAPISFMMRAAVSIVSSGDTSSTSRVITSLTFIALIPIAKSGDRPLLAWATRLGMCRSRGDFRLCGGVSGRAPRGSARYFAERRLRVPDARRGSARRRDV